MKTPIKPPRKIRTVILISGRGSNMNVLIEAAKAEDYPAEVALVISNKKDAPGLKLAQKSGISTLVIEQKGKDKTSFEADLQTALLQNNISFICLAGFMRILSADFLDQWEGRIINIHPSLLPEYPGLDTHKRALEAKCTTHGCSVHYVTADVDAGELIAQMRISVKPDDTEETLAARVLEAEHRLYPKALKLVIERLARNAGISPRAKKSA